jgi:hypothetical protein
VAGDRLVGVTEFITIVLTFITIVLTLPGRDGCRIQVGSGRPRVRRHFRAGFVRRPRVRVRVARVRGSAPPPGFEPGLSKPKSEVLPLHYGG